MYFLPCRTNCLDAARVNALLPSLPLQISSLPACCIFPVNTFPTALPATELAKPTAPDIAAFAMVYPTDSLLLIEDATLPTTLTPPDIRA